MVVSPATWDLIERLRPDLDVAIDVYDAALSPLLPDASHEWAQPLRTLTADREPGGGRQILQSAVRSGRHVLFSAGEIRVGVFPIRYRREVVGLLTAAAGHRRPESLNGEQSPAGQPPATEAADRRIERLGWTLRATLEADIALWEKLDQAEHRARWHDSVLRFLEYLHTCTSEAELFAAIVQAAAVWGDFDARVYRRTLANRFLVDAALPLRPAADGPDSFDAALVDGRASAFKVTSISELEQMGWRATSGEVILLPVGAGRQPATWLLAIAGPTEDRFVTVFEMIARTLTVRLDELLAQRSETALARLRARLTEPQPSVPATAASLLRELATSLPAARVRLLAQDPASGAMRPLASVGVALFGTTPEVVAPGQRVLAPERLLLPLEVDRQAPAALDITASLGSPFSPADAVVAERSAAWFEAWLAGAWRGLHLGARGLFTDGDLIDPAVCDTLEDALSSEWA
jgi:hypothetical protein